VPIASSPLSMGRPPGVPAPRGRLVSTSGWLRWQHSTGYITHPSMIRSTRGTTEEGTMSASGSHRIGREPEAIAGGLSRGGGRNLLWIAVDSVDKSGAGCPRATLAGDDRLSGPYPWRWNRQSKEATASWASAWRTPRVIAKLPGLLLECHRLVTKRLKGRRQVLAP
jgi:hypothetical protein